ncbi:MAG: phosphoribosylformylglycinamidine synthase subunit PurS [Dehalococcoidia bacterium]
MPTFQARINVMLKPLVNDPQGLAVRDGLHTLGFEGVSAVRVGKRIEVTLEASDAGAAEAAIRSMCEQLLANPVIEDFRFEVGEVVAGG